MPGFRTVGPNQAIIRSGGGDQPKIVVGGRTFVMPFLQRAQILSLEVMTLTVNTARVYTKAGVALSVDGVAQVKVARGEEAIRTAAQQFLGKTPQLIADIALQTLEGHQRAMLGTMTVEDIYQDRDAFATQVREVASTDMANMGMEIVSFTIRDIQDEHGYLEALGVRRTSEVKRDASIGQAEADRDATIRSAQASQESEAAKYTADTAVAESERDFSTQKVAMKNDIAFNKMRMWQGAVGVAPHGPKLQHREHSAIQPHALLPVEDGRSRRDQDPGGQQDQGRKPQNQRGTTAENIEGAFLHRRPSHQRAVAQVNDGEPVEVLHRTSQSGNMEQIGRQHDAHHLIVEVGQHLLQAIGLCTSQRKNHVIDPLLGNHVLEIRVPAQDRNPVPGGLGRAIRQDTHHAKP